MRHRWAEKGQKRLGGEGRLLEQRWKIKITEDCCFVVPLKVSNVRALDSSVREGA